MKLTDLYEGPHKDLSASSRVKNIVDTIMSYFWSVTESDLDDPNVSGLYQGTPGYFFDLKLVEGLPDWLGDNFIFIGQTSKDIDGFFNPVNGIIGLNVLHDPKDKKESTRIINNLSDDSEVVDNLYHEIVHVYDFEKNKGLKKHTIDTIKTNKSYQKYFNSPAEFNAFLMMIIKQFNSIYEGFKEDPESGLWRANYLGFDPKDFYESMRNIIEPYMKSRQLIEFFFSQLRKKNYRRAVSRLYKIWSTLAVLVSENQGKFDESITEDAEKDIDTRNEIKRQAYLIINALSQTKYYSFIEIDRIGNLPLRIEGLSIPVKFLRYNGERIINDLPDYLFDVEIVLISRNNYRADAFITKVNDKFVIGLMVDSISQDRVYQDLIYKEEFLFHELVHLHDFIVNPNIAKQGLERLNTKRKIKKHKKNPAEYYYNSPAEFNAFGMEVINGFKEILDRIQGSKNTDIYGFNPDNFYETVRHLTTYHLPKNPKIFYNSLKTKNQRRMISRLYKIWSTIVDIDRENQGKFDESITEALGPHQGKEIELMLSGKKPAGMIHDTYENRKTVKKLSDKIYSKLIRVLGTDYNIGLSLIGQEWRLDRLQEIYDESRIQGFMTKDNHTEIGRLFGYSEEDINHFLSRIG